jgi:hypothetical protein
MLIRLMIKIEAAVNVRKVPILVALPVNRVDDLIGDKPRKDERRACTGDSGARRTGFLGERENRSGVKTNRIPG